MKEVAWLRDVIIQISELSDASVDGALHIRRSAVYPSAPSQNCENRLLASSCMFICPSVRMDQLRFEWTDFYKISYLSIFRKIFRENSSSFKTDKNNGYCKQSPMVIYDSISLNST